MEIVNIVLIVIMSILVILFIVTYGFVLYTKYKIKKKADIFSKQKINKFNQNLGI
tara:strand:+ start:3922 stop:4086 length:165 start_codon:yes stop_codon:yes gene_type:complete